MRRHVFILLLLYYGTEFATAGLLMTLGPPLSKTDDGLENLHVKQLKKWTGLILPKREAKALVLYKDVEAEVHRAPDKVEFDESPRRPDVLARFTRESAKFITEKIASAAKEKLIRRRIDNITLSVLQLNITLHSVSIAELTFPTIDYEKISKNKVRASSRGGEVRLQGQYRSVYRTVREGHFEATVRGFNVEVDVTFDRNSDGRIKLVSDECKPSIGTVQAELKPFLLDDVLEAIEEHLLQTVKGRICEGVDLYLQDIHQHLPFVSREQSSFDFEVEFADGERVQRRLMPTTPISFTEDSLDVVWEPAQSKPFLMSSSPLASDEDDTSRMVYVYLSERFTKQLVTHLFIIPNANFKLHGDFAIDAVACDAEVKVPSCKPSLFGPKPLRLCMNSGRLRTWQRKQIDYKATDEGAKLRLHFSAAVTFDNFCAGRPVIVANFDLAADVLLESMKLTASDYKADNAGVQYTIEPLLYVEHVEVTNPRYFVPMQEELETRVAHEFPVRLMHSVLDNIQQATLRVPAAFGSNATVHFREHTMVISFDLPNTISVGTPIHL